MAPRTCAISTVFPRPKSDGESQSSGGLIAALPGRLLMPRFDRLNFARIECLAERANLVTPSENKPDHHKYAGRQPSQGYPRGIADRCRRAGNECRVDRVAADSHGNQRQHHVKDDVVRLTLLVAGIPEKDHSSDRD